MYFYSILFYFMFSITEFNQCLTPKSTLVEGCANSVFIKI